MPSKKKKKNPPVKSRPTARRQQDTYHLLGKVIAATLLSSLIVTLIFAGAAYYSPEAAVPGKNVLQFLPPIVGVAAAFIARPVKDFFNTKPSETVHAALISGLSTLLVFGLLLLLG